MIASGPRSHRVAEFHATTGLSTHVNNEASEFLRGHNDAEALRTQRQAPLRITKTRCGTLGVIIAPTPTISAVQDSSQGSITRTLAPISVFPIGGQKCSCFGDPHGKDDGAAAFYGGHCELDVKGQSSGGSHAKNVALKKSRPCEPRRAAVRCLVHV